jgi:hypothetical protein
MEQFNWEIYKMLNPDLEKVGLKSKLDYEKHFLMHGIANKRNYRITDVYCTFDWEIYKMLNPDLVKSGLRSKLDYEKHYLMHGIANKRKYKITDVYDKFEWEIYKILNPDLVKSGLRSKSDYEKHFLMHGIANKRKYKITDVYDTFEWEIYKILNPDLIKTGLNSRLEFEKHFLMHGIKEQRKFYIKKNNSNTITTKNIDDHIISFKQPTVQTPFQKQLVEPIVQTPFQKQLVQSNIPLVEPIVQTSFQNPIVQTPFQKQLVQSNIPLVEPIVQTPFQNSIVQTPFQKQLVESIVQTSFKNPIVESNIPLVKQVQTPFKNPIVESNIPLVKQVQTKQTIGFSYLKYINFSKCINKDDIYFYLKKMDMYINILKKKYNYLQINAFNSNIVAYNNYELDDMLRNNYIDLTAWLKSFTQNDFYIFDELAYSHFLTYYCISNDNKNILIDFFKKASYIVFFSDKFETYAKMNIKNNYMYSIEFLKLFFNNARYLYLSDYLSNHKLTTTEKSDYNVYLLIKYDIYLNIVIFPPVGYSKICNICNNTISGEENIKDIDILFYNDIPDNYYYKELLLNRIKDTCNQKGYKFLIYNSFGYEKNKDKVLNRIKVVVFLAINDESIDLIEKRICLVSNEMIAKKVFFMLNEFVSCIFNVYDVPRYKIENNFLDFKKIDDYIKNTDKRDTIINNNYDKISTNYDMDLILNLNNTINKEVTLKKCDIKNKKNIIYFDFGINNYHSIQKIHTVKYFENLKYNIIKIDVTFLSNNKKLLDYITNIQNKNEDFYILNAEDYYNLYCILDCKNTNVIMNFVENIDYIYYNYEVIMNDKLHQIGLNYDIFYIHNNYYYNINDRDKFTIFFYKNAYLILCSNMNNIMYLNMNNIKSNVKYFSPIGYSKFNDLIQLNINKVIDILFYGNLSVSFNYRTRMLNELQQYCNSNKYVFEKYDNLFDIEKNNKLAKTKIVIHVPSHENLETFPWAKCAELMANKVFFIIEENKDIYIKKIEDIVVYYKHSDIIDLQNKIMYYLSNEAERIKQIEKCYNYYINNHNMEDLLNFK